jgi:hypothetical protein
LVPGYHGCHCLCRTLTHGAFLHVLLLVGVICNAWVAACDEA